MQSPLVAEESADGPIEEAVDAVDEAAADEVGPWTYEAKFGAFLNQVASGGSENSRDPTIADTEDSISYKLKFDGRLTWAVDPNELRQDLKLRFGRTKEEGEGWTESADEIRYDATFFHFLWDAKRHFLYGSARVESVFTGDVETVTLVDPAVEPVLSQQLGTFAQFVPRELERDPKFFSPGLGFVATGYGQRYDELILPEADRLEWRAGVRAQKRWGDDLGPGQRDWQFGVEAMLDYSNQISETIDWFLHAEAFAPFDDLAHITSWAEAGITVQVHQYVSLEVSARGYYESHPEEIGPVPNDGYDEFSWRQEALLGVVIGF